MAKGIFNNMWIWMYICIIVFANNIEAQPNGNFFDSIANRAKEMYDSVGNGTHENFGSNIYDPIVNIKLLDSTANRTTEMYDTVANQTHEIVVSNIYDPIVNYTTIISDNILGNNATSKEEKIKDCSIVLGGALAGAVIGFLAVGFGIPLALCILGFTCCGIMAGSAAACCQSCIGDVPAGSCFSCLQSTGAGGGKAYIILSAVIGLPLGLGLGGYIAETYVHCFS